jgi:hypothetical protein
MEELEEIRSVSFDTSFLLKDSYLIDKIIDILNKDSIPCFITYTVLTELEQLKIFNRIDNKKYKNAIKRWKYSKANIIDFKNRFLSNEIGRACVNYMEKYHGVNPKDIKNDCNILVATLKNGIDVFLSEDYHFTSRITKEVVNNLTSAACKEYHQMCQSSLYSIDSRTFLQSYKKGKIDINIVNSKMKSIRKQEKYIKFKSK